MKPTQSARGALLAGLLAMTALAAEAGELAGVRLADTLAAGGQTLKLNGMGLRTKLVFKVYVAGLYLPEPARDAEAIVRADSPRTLIMEFVRDVKAGPLVEAYREGLAANNAAADLAAQQDAVERFLKIIPDVRSGDRLVFSYQPGQGSDIRVRDGQPLHIDGKAFADLLLRVYIGPKPPTAELKRGLLGG